MDAHGEFGMKKLLLIIFIFIMFQVVTAQQIYQEDTIVDVKVACFNNNSYCSPTSDCNITIIKFDGTTIINNLEKSYNPSYHN